MKCINFGIIGPGTIAHRFVKGMKYVESGQITAVASRDLEKAKSFAKQYEIDKYYGSYDEMLDDPAIDVVYIATPPHLHFDQVMQCLKKKKHVVCEKPFMVNSAQIKRAFAYAKSRNLFLMEAMKAVFLPTTIQAKKWIDDGKIGELKYIDASYCYDGKFDKSHWVYKKELGGGGMFDVGVYAAAYVQYMINSNIQSISKKSLVNDQQSDDLSCINILFKNNIIATIRGAIGVQTENKAMIYGTLGYIECNHFWKTDEVVLHVYGQDEEVYTVNQPSEFTYQIQEVVNCVLQGKNESNILSEEFSIGILDMIEG